MRCFYCSREACAKIGTAKGNIWLALLGKKVWDKKEVYVCDHHYNIYAEQKKDSKITEWL